MTNISLGRRTIAVDAGHWLIKSDDGSMVTMKDTIFRRWYSAVDREGQRALDNSVPFPQGPRRARPKRPKHTRGSTNQELLNL
jgi:hypothetical protein